MVRVGGLKKKMKIGDVGGWGVVKRHVKSVRNKEVQNHDDEE